MTSEAATRLGLSVSRTSHLLRSLEEAGLTCQLHGLWAIRRDVEPFSALPNRRLSCLCLVLVSARPPRDDRADRTPDLHRFLRKIRTIPTTITTQSIHQIVPELFDGYTGSEPTGYLATPEKARLRHGLSLLASRRPHLPPRTLTPEGFDLLQLEQWTSRIARPRVRTLVTRGL